jgi:hypothetical protein
MKYSIHLGELVSHVLGKLMKEIFIKERYEDGYWGYDPRDDASKPPIL